MGRALIDVEHRARLPSRRRTATAAERVPFDPGLDFEALTTRALRIAGAVPEVYGDVLRLLVDAQPASTAQMQREHRRGATFRQLAAIGHVCGMDKGVRGGFYRLAESIPLSAAHARLILDHLSERTT